MNVIRIFRLFLILFIVCHGQTVFAQEEKIKIIEDPRIDSLIRAQASPYDGMIKGFRIQLTTETSKNDIDKKRIQFITLFPQVRTYVIYNAPNYILKAGDFQHKEDALELQSQLKKFPYSFIKEELVNYHPK